MSRRDQTLERQGAPFILAIIVGSLVFVGGMFLLGSAPIPAIVMVVVGVATIVYGLFRFFMELAKQG